jgi:hypothetical protein
MMDREDWPVHLNHCCPGHCKYSDDDCPVALRLVLPLYKCEDCTCAEMNPSALLEAELWVKSMSDAELIQIYLRNRST